MSDRCKDCNKFLVTSHRKRETCSDCHKKDESDPELEMLLEALLPKPHKKKRKKKKKYKEVEGGKQRKVQTSSDSGVWPYCQKCHDKTEMVLRTNRTTLRQFWGCANFPNCRFTLPCSTKHPYKLRRDLGGPCPYCEAHIDQPYNVDGELMLWAHRKPANRCDKCDVDLVWIESRDGESKWWEFFPDGTYGESGSVTVGCCEREEPVTVSKKQEGHMPMFIEKKWYIVRKPSGSANTQETSAGRVIWDKNMDQYDGKPLEVNHMTRDGKLAYFKGIHSYAFHSGWTKGPFDTRQDAYQSMIKIVARREPDVEADIEEFENGLIEFYDKAVCEKIDKDSIHLRDPKTGVVSVVDKHVLETGGKRKSNMAKKIRDRWKNKKASKEAQEKYDKWCKGRPNVGEIEVSGDKSKYWNGSNWVEMTGQPRKLKATATLESVQDLEALHGSAASGFGVLGHDGVDAPDVPTQEEFDELKKKVDELAKPEEALVEKAKDLNEQYNDDIDDIFQDYHDRNKRRDELNERISSELGKDEEEKSGGWLYPVLAVGGSLAALGWAGYTLYPHLEGIRYYVGF